jgi:four helix bundle protein
VADETERSPTYENGQDIRERSFAFACRVVRFCQKLYDAGGVGGMLVPQLLNCSTSLPSMLEEARAAESRRDFISKCSIGLKEGRESWTRLRLCEACRLGSTDEARELAGEAGQLVAIVGAIVRNTRRNAGLSPGPQSIDRNRRVGSPRRIPNSQS